MIDVFRECREMVTAEDAARYYGCTFDRKGWAVCPFHSDRHPSMSFKNGRFRCWACNASGDSINFVARLLGLKPMAAVERLNTDFMLGLPISHTPTPEEMYAVQRRRKIIENRKKFEEWRDALCNHACTVFRVAHSALQRIATPEDIDKLSEQEIMAIQWQSYYEYLAEILTIEEPTEQMEIFQDRYKIQSKINQILKIYNLEATVLCR